MTYDQLVAFTTVAAEGTFTSASEALHKSQPAVSKLIRNLEGELGVVLFDRAKYRATLTDAGRVFYERAAAVIESTHALRGFGLARVAPARGHRPADPTVPPPRAPADRAPRQRPRSGALAQRPRRRPALDGDGRQREEGHDSRRHGLGWATRARGRRRAREPHAPRACCPRVRRVDGSLRDTPSGRRARRRRDRALGGARLRRRRAHAEARAQSAEIPHE